MNKPFSIPLPALFVLHTLYSGGFEAYIVGGAVRDILRVEEGELPANFIYSIDLDFTTNAQPEEILQLFPHSFYENSFGTVSITQPHLWELMGQTAPVLPSDLPSIEKAIELSSATKLHQSLQLTTAESPHKPTQPLPNYEITTYRSEGTYEDHRRPSSVTWGKTLEEDLTRRDFTINALALTIQPETISRILDAPPSSPIIEVPAVAVSVIDLFHGQDDLKAGLISTVGQPAERFSEDALRMLRAIRFSVQLNMRIADETFSAINQHAEHLAHVSWERIREEMIKILKSDFPAEGFELLDEAGLLPIILPELSAAKGVIQTGHHTTDVWTHSLDSLRFCPSNDPIVRLATLLHDIGKPSTFARSGDSVTFYNHEVVGARLAKSIARRWRLSTKDCERVFTLVRHHMFHYQPHNTDAAIRRFMRKVGLENVNDILDLREGDRLGSGARKTSWRLEEMKARMIEQLHQPMAVTDLALNGHDLMINLQLQPGPILGTTLQYLLEQVLDQPELNTKERLLEVARDFLLKQS